MEIPIKITAPFTAAQVEQLNRYQQLGMMHAFTCGTKEKHHAAHPALRKPVIEKDCDLIATTAGWVCPCCDYTQNWAHGFMADKEQLDKMEQIKNRFENNNTLNI
jgi:hypothetical protein